MSIGLTPECLKKRRELKGEKWKKKILSARITGACHHPQWHLAYKEVILTEPKGGWLQNIQEKESLVPSHH